MTTKIEWAEESWNPVVGCSKTSEGCTNCYAEKMALRLAHMALADIEAGRNPGRKRYYLDVVDIERKRWNGKVALVEEALEIPLRWRRPRKPVFCVSMGDLFHEDVPWSFIDRVFHTIEIARNHTFLMLTKRADKMLAYMEARSADFPLLNLWGMVTVENQDQVWRIDELMKCPFVVRGVSCEPLLGPVKLSGCLRCPVCGMRDWNFNKFQAGHRHIRGLDWVIAGGESGPGARPMHPDWLRGIRDQCQAAGVPFFFKQWGHYAPLSAFPIEYLPPRGIEHTFGDHKEVYRVGKKAAGRLLDGREWNEWPEAR